MIARAIHNGFTAMEDRGWDKIFYLVDLHSTVIKPNYQAGNIPKEFYPDAREVLKMISDMDDICLIMYTCSHPHEIEEYVKLFKSYGINFEYVNVNPEVKTQANGYGCYDTKPYMNVLFDDKAGFDGDTDWTLVKPIFKHRRLVKRLENTISMYGYGGEMKSMAESVHDERFADTLKDILKYDKL